MASDAIQSQAPPRESLTLWQWLRANLFNTWYNTIITLLLLYFIGVGIVNFLQWALTTPGWAAIIQNLRNFMVGPYPSSMMWRVDTSLWIVMALVGLSAGAYHGIMRTVALSIGGLMAALSIVVLLLPPSGADYAIPRFFVFVGSVALVAASYFIGRRIPARFRWTTVLLWVVALVLVIPSLLYGISNTGPLRVVETTQWGGFLLVTLSLSIFGIVGSFPIGILLALGRRSNLPVVKLFCTIYIEVMRGVPLISVLFLSNLMLPLFLPGDVRIENLFRAMVAVMLFSAAYLAENVRGGLQSIPNGQYEAAHALGLNYLQTTLLITLPQALRAVIPALVGQFISLFKDTSLVAIVGLLDLLRVGQAVMAQPDWLGFAGGVWREVLFFVSIIYFISCFSMSRISLWVERSLGVGER